MSQKWYIRSEDGQLFSTKGYGRQELFPKFITVAKHYDEYATRLYEFNYAFRWIPKFIKRWFTPKFKLFKVKANSGEFKDLHQFFRGKGFELGKVLDVKNKEIEFKDGCNNLKFVIKFI